MRTVNNGTGVLLIFLLFSLGGCSIYSVPGSESVPVEKQPDYTPVTPSPTPAKPDNRPTAPDTSGAYQGLMDRAEQASNRGDYEQSLALLERAQRIDPNNAAIYLELAKTYAAKGDSGLSQATAERGLLYCANATQCADLRRYADGTGG